MKQITLRLLVLAVIISLLTAEPTIVSYIVEVEE
jgi:hypothetical protein